VGKAEQQFEHLTDAQIEHYGDRTSGEGPNQKGLEVDQAIETHLADCAGCRTRVLEFHRSRFGLMSDPFPSAAWQSHPPTAECPSEDALQNLAAGLSSSSESATLTQHAAQCPHCGPILRAYTEDFSDDLNPEDQALLSKLKSSSPEWQKKMAQQMAAAVSPTPSSSVSKEDRVAQPPSAVQVQAKASLFRLPSLKWVLAPVALTATAVIAFFIWNAQRETPKKVEKLLAQAYTEQRTMEMRIPYAAHSDFRQTRGENSSLLSSPEALRKATDVIAVNLKKSPDDPNWLLLSARLDLLDWRYKSALSTLNKIDNEKVEDSPEFRLAQSLSLYEKAEIEHDPQSYGQVVDLLGKTLQKNPDDTVALFNQAVACEKLYMYECAASDYEHFLKVDPNSGWSNEAREHLKRIKEKKTPER
jgi:tetratricopeptide (TPR) repeat protein